MIFTPNYTPFSEPAILFSCLRPLSAEVAAMAAYNNRLLLGVGIAFLFVTAGCMGLATGDPDPETIATEIENRHENIDSVEGVKISETESGGETMRQRTTVVEIPGNVSKRVVTESDNDQFTTEGQVTLTRDGVTRIYDPQENTVTEYDIGSDRPSGITGGAVDADQIEQILDDSNVSYEGTDRVADREVHVITINRTATKPTSTVTAYVDKEFWYPLRTEMTFSSPDGEETTIVSYFESVEFNGDVSAEDVTLDVPEDATVQEHTGPETQEFESIAAVKEAAQFDIGDPELGDQYTFESANEMIMDGTVSYTLTYKSSDATIRHTVSNQTDYELAGESVDLNGTEAYLQEYDDSTTVLWEQDDRRHTLGGNADREKIITAATTLATDNNS